jgi:hypothetical protein
MQSMPQFMGKGSEGPVVNLLLAFLCGAGYGDDIKLDGIYGDTTEKRLKEFQKKNNLEEDGTFGSETRKHVKDVYGFDFEEACQSMSGTETFIKDGDKSTMLKIE